MSENSTDNDLQQALADLNALKVIRPDLFTAPAAEGTEEPDLEATPAAAPVRLRGPVAPLPSGGSGRPGQIRKVFGAGGLARAQRKGWINPED